MSPSEQLNRSEVRVATRVWQGNTNPEIAVAFGTSEQVIKNHLRSIFDKLGVWSRLELALYVAAHGGADWDGPRRSRSRRRLVVARSPRRDDGWADRHTCFEECSGHGFVIRVPPLTGIHDRVWPKCSKSG
jgi:DNA-binding CsgD family transcriptional regulator